MSPLQTTFNCPAQGRRLTGNSRLQPTRKTNGRKAERVNKWQKGIYTNGLRVNKWQKSSS